LLFGELIAPLSADGAEAASENGPTRRHPQPRASGSRADMSASEQQGPPVYLAFPFRASSSFCSSAGLAAKQLRSIFSLLPLLKYGATRSRREFPAEDNWQRAAHWRDDALFGLCANQVSPTDARRLPGHRDPRLGTAHSRNRLRDQPRCQGAELEQPSSWPNQLTGEMMQQPLDLNLDSPQAFCSRFTFEPPASDRDKVLLPKEVIPFARHVAVASDTSSNARWAIIPEDIARTGGLDLLSTTPSVPEFIFARWIG
jgi:hypothetical protein